MTPNDVDEARRIANEACLAGRELLDRPYSEVSRVCNGIGPSMLPGPLRDMLSRLHPSLKVVADIHDMGYYHGDGTEADWHRKNAEFAENGSRMAKYRYCVLNPLRYKVIWDARKFSRICNTRPGWLAYLSAIAERLNRNDTE